MKKSLILFLTISIYTFTSCNSQNKENSKNNKSKNIKQYIGTWLFLEQKNDKEYVYCTDILKSIRVSETSILNHTPMEDSEFKIDHFIQKNSFIYFYLDNKETSYYKFEWINKEKGIAKWILNNYEGDIYVNELYISNFKKEKCEQEDKPKGFQCEIADLSKIFDFKIFGTEFENEEDSTNPLVAEINIIKKSNPIKVQEIRFEPNSWIMFKDIPCDAISYFNNEGSLKEDIDNHHNFIIADYNFDGLEDFAYIWDIGGNGGALYSFYFQNKEGMFIEAKDFPLQNGAFPSEINIIKKTLTTTNPVGCCKINKTIYQLENNSKWKLISSKQEAINSKK